MGGAGECEDGDGAREGSRTARKSDEGVEAGRRCEEVLGVGADEEGKRGEVRE